MAMRFGLLGTGYWAAEVHAAGLAAEPGAELAGVWGRDPVKARALAERYATDSYDDVGSLLDDVDAVAVALPPDIQAPLAARAARAGRHLLLDKPLALSTRDAVEVVRAVEGSGVASVVFFTSRYLPEVAAWLPAAAAQQWTGGQATWLGSIFTPGNPFAGSPWRREKGGLWDVGPHALSIALAVLGPVREVAAAVRDDSGAVHLVLLHAGGAASTVSVSLTVPEAAQGTSFRAYGPSGWTAMPDAGWEAVLAYQEALRQLMASSRTAAPRHPCDVHFGLEVVEVLERAQALLNQQ